MVGYPRMHGGAWDALQALLCLSPTTLLPHTQNKKARDAGLVKRT